MKHPPIDLEGLLGTAPGMSAKRPEVFALIVLGLSGKDRAEILAQLVELLARQR